MGFWGVPVGNKVDRLFLSPAGWPCEKKDAQLIVHLLPPLGFIHEVVGHGPWNRKDNVYVHVIM